MVSQKADDVHPAAQNLSLLEDLDRVEACGPGRAAARTLASGLSSVCGCESRLAPTRRRLDPSDVIENGLLRVTSHRAIVHPRAQQVNMCAMEQRISLVTLGVRDLGRARAFYEGLGWRAGAGPDDDVVFFQAGGVVVALWGREALAGRLGRRGRRRLGRRHARAQRALSGGSRRGARRGADAPERGSPARAPRRSGAGTRASSSIPTVTPGRSHTTRTGRSRTTARSASHLPRRDRPPLRHADEAVARDARGDGARRGRRRAAARGSDRARARASGRPSFLGQDEAVYLPTATMANQIALAILGRARDGADRRGDGAHHGRRARRRGDALRPADARAARLPRPHLARAGAYGGACLGRLPHPAGLGRCAREHAQQRRRNRLAARGAAQRSSRRRASSASSSISTAPASRMRLSPRACRRPRSAGRFDTVTLCLSKGLGAPLGAVIAGLARADGAGASREAPLRRGDAAGRDRRRGRPVRARAQRRPARGRPRARAAARRGLARSAGVPRGRAGRDELRPASTSARSASPRPRRSRGSRRRASG